MELTKSYEYFQPEKVTERIHIIGCGSVGGTVAELLVRMGLKKITLYDFDTVCAHNLVNQIYRAKDIGQNKATALAEILKEIEPSLDLKVKTQGWNGQRLSGYVFLCADSMKVRRQVVEQNFDNLAIRAMFDFRTSLESAQNYAADWQYYKNKKDFLGTMQFTDEEAAEETPTSACGITLGVAPTVRGICTMGVANFLNWVRKGELKKQIVFNVFGMDLFAV